MTDHRAVNPAAPVRHSSARLLRGVAGLCALALAAWGGASWQAWRAPAPDSAQRLALDSRLRGESAALQGSIAGLAGKLGELQGRVLAMEAVRERVARAAGLSYTAPELVHGDAGPDTDAVLDPVPDAEVMDDIPAQLPQAFSAQSAERLGRRIDALGRRLEHQEDAYALVDAALSRQAGFQASLPTLSPVDYPYLSSSFGWRRNPVSGRQAMHEGLDFVAPRGAPIHAASGGLVVRAGRVRGYGNLVEIDHGNGLQTRYAHASSVLVRPGDIVRQGDLIARVGSTGRSTGAHLHFEVRMADYPLDPALFIGQDAQSRLAEAGSRLASRDPQTDPAGPTQLR